jgi:hypothetical protein
MAGERLIQVIDIARFRAVRPALDELDAGRALSLESRAVLQEAAASPFAHSRDRLGFAVLLGRILRHPELELRVFLAPRELDEVIEGVVHVLCFENGAEFSLVTPVGPSWVVLDRALAVFGDLDWFRATFFRAFDPNAEDRLLAYPRAGLAGRYYVLSREDVVRVAAELRPLLDDPIPTEITPLLAARAEQLHARYAEEISAAKEAMTALLLQRPDLLKPDEYNDIIVAYRNGSPVRIRDIGQAIEAPENDLLAMALSQEVRAAAEGLARLAAKALSREELTLAHTSLL